MDTKQLIANYVHLDMKDGELIMASGLHMRKIKDKLLQEILVTACQIWRTPLRKTEVRDRLCDRFAHMNRPMVNFALDILQSGPFLIEDQTYDPNDRYSRHTLYFNLNRGDPRRIQDRIRASKVAIIGCGGIGNYMSIPLATSGVGELVLVDYDRVELSNLTRQIMFTEKDVGKSKIEVLGERIRERNSQTKVTLIDLKIERYSDLEVLPPDIDLFVLSADGVTEELDSVVFLMNKYCIEHSVPFLNVGYIEDLAVWGPFVFPGETACQNCERTRLIGNRQDSALARKIAELNGSYQAPSSSPVNALAASAALSDVLRHLGQFGRIMSKGKRVGIKTDSYEKIEMCFEKNPSCYCQAQ